MKGINYVCLSGNLGAEPELRHTRSGAAVAELRLATNRTTTKIAVDVIDALSTT